MTGIVFIAVHDVIVCNIFLYAKKQKRNYN